MSALVLVCDDEELIRWSLCEHLTIEGFETISANNGQECLDMVQRHAPALVFLDLKMPVMDGLTALRTLRESDRDLPVIVITAHGGVESAIEATRLGASGYIEKPFDLRTATLAARKAVEEHRLWREVQYLRSRVSSGYGEIVGASPSMLRMFETLRRIEGVDAPTVLIQGESGTGKDLVAQAIHSRGPRRGGPFMEIDCTALPEQLMESELFGHERGAFTDARATKRGLFELASGGVLFLDEVGELPLTMQAKLLRALENRRFRRVGGIADIPMNVALVAATNRNLRDAVKAGQFREDLFFRLHVVPVEVPPLRERREDIPVLVSHFIDRFNKSFNRNVTGVQSKAMELLQSWRWPGNVRELRNVIERAVILLGGDTIQLDDLPAELRFASPADRHDSPFILPEEGIDLEALEQSLLKQALARTDGNQSAAARLLGISRYALRYRMDKLEEAHRTRR